MIFKSRDILPAIESRSINQQSDFALLTDDEIDLGRSLAEVVNFQFIRDHDPQCIGGDNFCFDHAKHPSWVFSYLADIPHMAGRSGHRGGRIEPSEREGTGPC
jgi:hypothetical protein